ncbi:MULTISPECIES: hypothetical protein [unclassified Kribbella]|uniref:hypothetical protein n=1 Tax=unclassified Kribbella TaxID=2644121 RepID=UPI0030193CA3
MSEGSSSALNTDHRVDQAAVLGATLAATVSISAADGPWEPMESVVGAVLICLVITYVDAESLSDDRYRRRRVALASVLGVCWCLVIAWPLQLALSGLGLGRWTDFLLPLLWIVLAWSQVRRMRRGRPPWPRKSWLMALTRRL